VLLQHHQGQVTTTRITAFLAGLGVAISKRQVVRLLTAKGAAASVAEAQAVLRAGLATARWITVDDTGARRGARNAVTTQIGDDRFTVFCHQLRQESAELPGDPARRPQGLCPQRRGVRLHA
jgi:hypothetical protein